MTILNTFTNTSLAADVMETLNSRHNQNRALVNRNKPGRILVAGDSKAVITGGDSVRSALTWALARAMVMVSPGTGSDQFGIGATTTGTEGEGTGTPGLLSATRNASIVNRIKTLDAAGENVIVLVKAGTNDGGTAENVIGNFRRIVANYIAAGASHVVLLSLDPEWGMNASQTARNHSINTGMRLIAQQNRLLVSFCDSTFGLLSPGSEVLNALGSTNDPVNDPGAYGSVMYDGLHESGYGGYIIGRELAPILQRLMPARTRMIQPDGFAAGGDNLRGDYLGSQLMFTRGGGQASQSSSAAANLSGMGVSAFPRGGSYPEYTFTTAGVTITSDRAPYPPFVAEFGRSDILVTKLTFSGTATGDGGFNIFGINGDNFGSGDTYEWEHEYYAENLTGTSAMRNACTVGGSNVDGQMTYMGNTKPADWIPLIHGRFNLHSKALFTTTSAGQFLTFSTGTSWRAGNVVSGSLYLLGAVVCKTVALPAATSI